MAVCDQGPRLIVATQVTIELRNVPARRSRHCDILSDIISVKSGKFGIVGTSLGASLNRESRPGQNSPNCTKLGKAISS